MSNLYPVLSETPGRLDTDLGGTAPAAADITDATATGIALVTAANAAAARTAIAAIGASTLTSDGDLLTRASGAPARLAPGSNGKILTMVAGAPAWASSATAAPTASVALAFTFPPGGGVHIDVTVTAGGSPVDGALVEVWMAYPYATLSSWSLATGTQVEIANPGYPTGYASRLVLRTNASGFGRVFAGATAGGACQVGVRAIYPDAAPVSGSTTFV